MRTVLREFVRFLLVESRLKDVQEEFSHQLGKFITKLSVGDPSGKNKYLEWMAKTTVLEVYSQHPYIATSEEIRKYAGPISDEVIDLVQKFYKNQERLKEKDINKYDFKTLRHALDNLPKSKTQQKKEAKAQGADVLLDTKDILILHPQTQDAVCHYGRGTKWCITDAEHFKGYQKENTIFYFVFDKKRSSDNPNYKIAVAVKRDQENEIDSLEYYDAEDDELDRDYLEENCDNWNLTEDLIISDAKQRESVGINEQQIFATANIEKMREEGFFPSSAKLENYKVVFESEKLSELASVFAEGDEYNSFHLFHNFIYKEDIWDYNYFYDSVFEEWKLSKGAAMADIINSKNEELIRNLLIDKYPKRVHEIDEMDLREICEDYDFEDHIKSPIIQAYVDALHLAYEDDLHDNIIGSLEEKFDLTRGADKWLVGVRYDMIAEILEDSGLEDWFEENSPIRLEDIADLFGEYTEYLRIDLKYISGDVREQDFNDNLFINL